MRRAGEIASVYHRFRAGRRGGVAAVEDWVRRVLYGGNWRFGDPEAVQQDAVLELHRLAERGAVRDPGSFQKLVYVVAKRVCVDHYHRERTRSSHEAPADLEGPEPAGASDPEADLESSERWNRLLYVFQKLSAACRELWDLVYREGLGAREVGERLGITAGNVRVRAHRCLEKARGIASEAGLAAGSAESRER